MLIIQVNMVNPTTAIILKHIQYEILREVTYNLILVLFHDTINLIHPIQRPSKPFVSKSSSRKSKSAMSKTFSRSVLIIFPCVLLFWMWQIRSTAATMLFKMQQPFRKTECEMATKKSST